MNKFIIAVLALAVLSGCGIRVQTYVENHSNLTGVYQGASIAVVGYPPERNKSLAWKSHKTFFETELRRVGFRVANSEDTEYVAVVSYGIDDGTTTSAVVSSPRYGKTGGGYTTHSGTVSSSSGGFGNYYGSSYTQPTYGVVGTNVSTVTSTIFKRALTVNIANRKTQERVFEGTAKSKGSCGNITMVLPYLTESMFKKFPAGSGEIILPGGKRWNC